MVRITPALMTGATVLCAAVGCAHFVEMQAIKHFTAALEKGDLDRLKTAASDSFDEKALRREDSIDVLKFLKLHPEEKVTVVKVEDVSETEKRVVVTTGKTHRRMLYKLIRNSQSGKWVVDDIVLKKDSKDVTAVKSVTEQMDLLLVVQDFLVAWHAGDRSTIDSVTTVAFGKLLKDLPAAHLERLTKRVAGERIKPEEFRPEAHIDGNDAVVKLQRTKGVLILTMKQTKKGWRVAEVQVDSRKDKDLVPSTVKTATVIGTVVKFLKAYKADDRTALESLSAKGLYDECLRIADLKMFALPTAESLGDKDEVTLHAKGAQYVLHRDKETVKLSLSLKTPENDDTVAPAYVVDDVTIYDAKQEKRLTALYTAQAKMQLFIKAILRGDLPLVQENSSTDLKTKVWNRLGPLSIADVLPPEIQKVAPVIGTSDFHGSVIRIHVHQGDWELTYVLRDWSSEVTVDDVLMPVMDRPESMKETIQALLPIRIFRAAVREASLAADGHDHALALLKSISSTDFNRLVWSQISQIPESAFSALPHLELPLASIKDSPNGQTVVFGDERLGCRVDLVRHKESLVIDRILLMNAARGEPVELKHELKSHLAKRGPRGLESDPMSQNPIATDPPRTAQTDRSPDGAATADASADRPARTAGSQADPSSPEPTSSSERPTRTGSGSSASRNRTIRSSSDTTKRTAIR